MIHFPPSVCALQSLGWTEQLSDTTTTDKPWRSGSDCCAKQPALADRAVPKTWHNTYIQTSKQEEMMCILRLNIELKHALGGKMWLHCAAKKNKECAKHVKVQLRFFLCENVRCAVKVEEPFPVALFQTHGQEHLWRWLCLRGMRSAAKRTIRFVGSWRNRDVSWKFNHSVFHWPSSTIMMKDVICLWKLTRKKKALVLFKKKNVLFLCQHYSKAKNSIICITWKFHAN